MDNDTSEICDSCDNSGSSKEDLGLKLMHVGTNSCSLPDSTKKAVLRTLLVYIFRIEQASTAILGKMCTKKLKRNLITTYTLM